MGRLRPNQESSYEAIWAVQLSVALNVQPLVVTFDGSRTGMDSSKGMKCVASNVKVGSNVTPDSAVIQGESPEVSCAMPMK